MSARTINALDLYEKGYTCSQSVLCAFAGDIGVEPEEAYRLGEGFGGGMGLMQKECGALAGAYMVIGHFYSDGDTNGGDSKAYTYQKIRAVSGGFQSIYGATDCKSILNGEVPKAHQCGEKVRNAVVLVEKLLQEDGLL